MKPSSDPKEVVATGYDRVAARYAELETADSEWPRMRWLREVLARLPDGSDVLDVGCGSGVPATKLIAERHRATGIDVSAVQIELARRNISNARLIHGDVMSVAFPAESFDGISAFYVVEHVPREEHAQLFSRFERWLRPGGYLVFTIEPEDEPGVVGDWLGAPMFFSQFDSEKTLELVRGAGFRVIRHAIESQTEGGKEVAYLWVLARKQPLSAPGGAT